MVSVGCAADCPPCESNPPTNTPASSTAPETAPPDDAADACSEARLIAEQAGRTVDVLERAGLEFVAAAADLAEADLRDAFPEVPDWRIEQARESAAEGAVDAWTRSAEAKALDGARVDSARFAAEASAACGG